MRVLDWTKLAPPKVEPKVIEAKPLLSPEAEEFIAECMREYIAAHLDTQISNQHSNACFSKWQRKQTDKRLREKYTPAE